MDMKIIRIENKLCTCCMEEHDVKIIHVKEQTTFKNILVNYTAEYYYCDVAKELYMDESMITNNDLNMKNAYRKETGLFTSDEICAIRAKYGISQSDLCVLLGWGGKTITRYEGHQVQDKAHDTILKKLDDDPEWFLHLLIEAKTSFATEVYKRYYDTVTHLYEINRDSYLRKAIEAKYVRFYGNELYTGNTSLSLNKVVDVIRYFANSSKVTNLYKVKLMKLLWYADFFAYRQQGNAITGLVYQAMPMGAVPIGHESIINLKGVPCEEIDVGDGIAYRFNANDIEKYPSLQDKEIKILDRVITKLGQMSKNEIVEFMHNEQAYKETALKDIISFKYAESLLI